ncbi:FLYWCH zinc finger domain-containing protein [Ditylenchus destructor]|uniref:FLYWCH zinc finger domain-containing protein n=1 Tax=Ditylenchus destructor TaxID=166010 RepID=A0AAD4N6T8_9BILA|nr:FLYWCH zinc finger domain-containing protein [Ditylenchus destructor]
MSRDRFVDFSALMEERSSSVSEDSSSQAEEENSRDTVASDVANVPDIHHGPVIQAIQTLKTEKGNLKFVYESHEFWQYKTSKDHLQSFWRCAKFQKAACPCRIHCVSYSKMKMRSILSLKDEEIALFN